MSGPGDLNEGNYDEAMELLESRENPDLYMLSQEHIYRNSGHKMLCPTCKSFQRTSATLKAEDHAAVLVVMCKSCKTTEEFVYRRGTGFVPRAFLAKVEEFTRRRAREILGGKN